VTVSVDLEVPARALAVSAHPDDSEFGCGATLAKWSARGCVASLVVCTDGSKGSWDPDAEVAALVKTRQREQRAAADALGLTGEVAFLGFTDGDLHNTGAARSQLAALIRRLRPTVLLGHDPWKRYRLHPDHREAGLLTCDSLVAARDPHFFPEHDLSPHRPDTLLLFEADAPDHVEDATGFAAAKIAALLSHESQFESTMGIAADDDGSERKRFEQRIQGELAVGGACAGITAGEAFKRIDEV
jgi:LmbE family N-acetylglucosaminyl deacetylase